MPKVTIVNTKQEIEVPEGANLRQAAMKAGVPLYKGLDRFLNCRGLGLCGTCRILVKSGADHLTSKTVMEKLNLTLHPMSMLASLGHEKELRLSCQAKVTGDCAIEVTPPFNWSGENFWQKPYPNK